MSTIQEQLAAMTAEVEATEAQAAAAHPAGGGQVQQENIAQPVQTGQASVVQAQPAAVVQPVVQPTVVDIAQPAQVAAPTDNSGLEQQIAQLRQEVAQATQAGANTAQIDAIKAKYAPGVSAAEANMQRLRGDVGNEIAGYVDSAVSVATADAAQRIEMMQAENQALRQQIEQQNQAQAKAEPQKESDRDFEGRVRMVNQQAVDFTNANLADFQNWMATATTRDGRPLAGVFSQAYEGRDLGQVNSIVNAYSQHKAAQAQTAAALPVAGQQTVQAQGHQPGNPYQQGGEAFVAQQGQQPVSNMAPATNQQMVDGVEPGTLATGGMTGQQVIQPAQGAISEADVNEAYDLAGRAMRAGAYEKSSKLTELADQLRDQWREQNGMG